MLTGKAAGVLSVFALIATMQASDVFGQSAGVSESGEGGR